MLLIGVLCWFDRFPFFASRGPDRSRRPSMRPNICVTPAGILFDAGLLLIILNDQLSLATHSTGADNARASSIPEGRLDMQCPSWFAVSRAVVLLFYGTLMVSWSQAPPEAAPEFPLPLSQVTTAPPTSAEAAETASAPSRLRYVAVPRGHQFAGMAHAHCCETEALATRRASCSEESCFTRGSGQDTDRNRRTNLEAVAPWRLCCTIGTA